MSDASLPSLAPAVSVVSFLPLAFFIGTWASSPFLTSEPKPDSSSVTFSRAFRGFFFGPGPDVEVDLEIFDAAFGFITATLALVFVTAVFTVGLDGALPLMV